MNVAGRNAPLSPISVGGSEWSYSKYQTPDDGSYPNNRGNLASPPNSGGSNGAMSMNGFPAGPRSIGGGPSPPPSIGRSSNGTGMYARSENGRTNSRPELDEGILGEHYVALKAFLNTRDSTSKQQPNKARDKLLRLSPVQFYELSTDVFDELMRRQAAARAPPNGPKGPPTFLLPEKAFHPKRNQARQRLSSLGPPRFRDLASDVFHELERRFPRFQAGDIPRLGSGMSMRGGPPNRTGTPANGGNQYPPRGQSRMRRPSDASSLRGPPPADLYGVPPSPGLPNGDYNRPLPKQLNQNNTIVPNKSTMLEEDDGPDGSEADKKLIEEYQTQVQDLQEKLESAEDALKKKDIEMSSALDGERSRATAVNMEKKEWADIRLSLEDKLAEAQSLNQSLKLELERVRDDHTHEINGLQGQLGGGGADAVLTRENTELRQSLQQQQQVTEEVRREAQGFLHEMRTISQQSASTYEKQVDLERTVEQLEQEVGEWKNRYARIKTQLGSMRGSSLGLSVEEDISKLRDRGFLQDNGLVKDVHVTKYQIAIDELLQRARKDSPEKATEAMKSVVVSVRRITKDVEGSTAHNDETAQQLGKLKARVSSTANNLITASKNFAAGAGISPVSLVDAAATHLTVAIVELLRTAKIRQTPAEELDDDDDGTMTPVGSAGFFSSRSTTRGSSTNQESLPPPPAFQGLGGVRASAESSAYSPVSSPRASIDPYSRNGTDGLTNGYALSSHDGHVDDYKMHSYGGF